MLFVGVGAVVGALVGGGAGFGVSKFKSSRAAKPLATPSIPEVNKQLLTLEDTASSKALSIINNDEVLAPETTVKADEQPIVAAKPIEIKFEVFGVQTTYFSATTEFFTPLSRFETFLQFAEERTAFRRVVEHVDHLLGMDTLLHGRTPISKTSMPTIAQSARNKALRLLNEITTFSNKRRPSATKEKDMLQIIDEIKANMDDIIKSMHTTVAALEFEIKK
jgi:hypothetical protein